MNVAGQVELVRSLGARVEALARGAQVLRGKVGAIWVGGDLVVHLEGLEALLANPSRRTHREKREFLVELEACLRRLLQLLHMFPQSSSFVEVLDKFAEAYNVEVEMENAQDVLCETWEEFRLAHEYHKDEMVEKAMDKMRSARESNCAADHEADMNLLAEALEAAVTAGPGKRFYKSADAAAKELKGIPADRFHEKLLRKGSKLRRKLEAVSGAVSEAVLAEEDPIETGSFSFELGIVMNQGSFGTSHVAELKKKHCVCRIFPRRRRSDVITLAREWKNLRHKNIIGFKGLGMIEERDQVQPCLLLERMEKTLEEYLHSNPGQGRLQSYLWRSAMLEIAAGLGYLHEKGHLHGNLQPANILVSGEGMTFIKLTDFGMPISHENFAPYKAPELFQNAHKKTIRSDAYAFGVIVWELVEQSRPWHGLNAGQIRQEVVENEKRPPFDRESEWESDLKDLARRCWNIDVIGRPTSSEIMAILRGTNNRESIDSTTGESWTNRLGLGFGNWGVARMPFSVPQRPSLPASSEVLPQRVTSFFSRFTSS